MTAQTIGNVRLADHIEDNDTVQLYVTSGNKKERFYVQTSDGKFRPELGCWILTDKEENIDSEDYPEFDFDEIIYEAENFMEKKDLR